MRWLALAMVTASLVACSSDEKTAVPAPVRMTEEAVGHYCQMIVLDHAGPKAQVHLAGIADPFWFTQVRDALAFDRLPEETAEVAAIYVNDMGAAKSWEEPGADNWILAAKAVYVVGSRKRGGMGAPEFVPFAEQAAAERFASDFGGSVIAYSQISDEMVLEPVNVDLDGRGDGAPSNPEGGLGG
jgi:copper chaperone NosL